MTNSEKYKGAKERAEAFVKFCRLKNGSEPHSCSGCGLAYLANVREKIHCHFAWLDLEAPAEEPLPCPFCGKPCSANFNHENRLVVECDCCCYSTASYDDELQAIAAHNRVAIAAKEKEANDATA